MVFVARALKITHRGFSDSFVLTVPLATDSDPRATLEAVSSLWFALYGIAALGLSALARVPVRGGIEVGLARNLFPGEAYGPAMLNGVS